MATVVDNVSDSNAVSNTQSQSKVKNPVFITSHSELGDMDDKVLYLTYHKVLVLCLKDSFSEKDTKDLLPIYKATLTSEELKTCAKHLVLVPSSTRLLKNSIHKSSAVIVEKDDLAVLNADSVELTDEEIVIPILNLKQSNLNKYLALYDNEVSITDLVEANILFQYFNCNSYRNAVQMRISNIARSAKEGHYWTNYYNCLLNMTEAFMQRSFNLKEIIQQNNKALALANTLSNDDSDIKEFIRRLERGSSNSNYLDYLSDKTVYVDAASTIKKKDRRLYKPLRNETKYTKQMITEWFHILPNELARYDFFNTLLVSKEYCDKVLNNTEVMKIMAPTIKKFMPLYRYVMGYAWLTLYLEECIIKTRTTIQDRYVFTLDTARELPQFPFLSTDLHMNPYTPILIASRVMRTASNSMGIKMLNNFNGYKLVDLDTFKKRMNLFVSGTAGLDLFKGVKWGDFAVSGSIMPASLPTQSPLMLNLKKDGMTDDELFLRYVKEYYNESDVDVMCNEPSVFKFMDKVSQFAETIQHNIAEAQDIKDTSDIIKIVPNKSMLIVVNDRYIREKMSNEFDPDEIISNFKENWVRELFYQEYTSYKFKSNRNYRKEFGKRNKLFEHFYSPQALDEMNLVLTVKPVDGTDKETDKKFLDSEHVVFLNDILPKHKQVSKEDNYAILKISENIKFKLKSTYLRHDLEVFRIKYPDYFSVVARFHLPCVRSYFSGDQVYLLPSSISAYMTQTNMDYKYFAGIRDPVEILNKYRLRGYGTVINGDELITMTDYNSVAPHWKDFFKLDLKDRDMIKKQYGPMEISDKRFRMGEHFYGAPATDYSTPTVSYINNHADLRNYYKVKYGYDSDSSLVNYFKFKIVNEDGFVEPLQSWVFEAAWKEFSK